MVQLVPPRRKKTQSQYARLKTDQLCNNLLYIIRANLKQADLLTRPKNVQAEIKVMNMYKNIVTYLSKQLEDETTLEKDNELLVQEKNWNIKMGILYRAERKRIVRSQIHLINQVISIVTSCLNPLSKQEFNSIVLNKTE